MYLKRKLNEEVNPTKLGFPKLKHLLLALDSRIAIEFMSHNHPFAFLKDYPSQSDLPLPTSNSLFSSNPTLMAS